MILVILHFEEFQSFVRSNYSKRLLVSTFFLKFRIESMLFYPENILLMALTIEKNISLILTERQVSENSLFFQTGDKCSTDC